MRRLILLRVVLAMSVLSCMGGRSGPAVASGNSVPLPPASAMLHALFPVGAPKLAYTLYRYSGPLEQDAAIAAAVWQTGHLLVLVKLEVHPRSGGPLDSQGAVIPAILALKGKALRVLARGTQPVTAAYAGRLTGAALSADDPGSGDLSVRYSVILSGSGALKTSMQQVYRLRGSALTEVIAAVTDQHIEVGSCCVYGSAAEIGRVIAAGPAVYTLRNWGYTRRNGRMDTYRLPGLLLYRPHGTTYRADSYQVGSQAVQVNRLPLLVALPDTPAFAAAASAIPDTSAALPLPGESLPGVVLTAVWSSTALLLTLTTAPAWPHTFMPRRVDAYLGSGDAVRHLTFAGSDLSCTAGTGYAGRGWQCTVMFSPGQALAVGTLPQPPSADPGPDHRYRLAATARLSLALTGSSGAATLTCGTDPRTDSSHSGTLSTLLVLSPSIPAQAAVH